MNTPYIAYLLTPSEQRTGNYIYSQDHVGITCILDLTAAIAKLPKTYRLYRVRVHEELGEGRAYKVYILNEIVPLEHRMDAFKNRYVNALGNEVGIEKFDYCVSDDNAMLTLKITLKGDPK